MAAEMALWADCRGREANPHLVRFQQLAMARSKLSERGALWPREQTLGGGDCRRAPPKNGIRAQLLDGPENRVCVYALDCGLVAGLGDDAIH